MLARNYTNAEIATELVISPKTVRNYVRPIPENNDPELMPFRELASTGWHKCVCNK